MPTTHLPNHTHTPDNQHLRVHIIYAIYCSEKIQTKHYLRMGIKQANENNQSKKIKQINSSNKDIKNKNSRTKNINKGLVTILSHNA